MLGHDLKVIQFGWPLGLPLVKYMGQALWECRSHLSNKRKARILFCHQNQNIVLLHGFIKKSQKTPLPDLTLARKRLLKLEHANE